MLLHLDTWSEKDYFCLKDSLVETNSRTKGLGRQMIEYIYDFAKQKDCSHVYWLTQEHNQTARLLYDNLAKQTDFVQYRYVIK